MRYIDTYYHTHICIYIYIYMYINMRVLPIYVERMEIVIIISFCFGHRPLLGK